MATNPFKHVAIIGAGTMGLGITQLCVLGGYQVKLYDVQLELLKAGLASISKNIAHLVNTKKLDASKINVINAIELVNDINLLQADLIIEAAIEKLEIKQQIFTELEACNKTECLFTSNTSSLSITQIAAGLKHPDRFAGLHFFNPAPMMKLVEVVRGASTSDTTIERLKEFSLSLSKIPVCAQDSPGFIVNRIARHFYVEALKLVEEGVSDFETIDTLTRSAGFKMGPFELMDLIGLDVNLAVTKSIYQSFNQDSKFRPSRIQQQKVDAGHLGKKSGKGFYEYPKS
jgi:3-hydroxybutyryl-CoA dehydrogenase